MHHPFTPHWQVIKRILRYLNHTQNSNLYLFTHSSFTLSVHVDADWAGNLDDCKSTARYNIYLDSHLIYWGSKEQSIVARSSTKTEYKSVANTTCELLWLQSPLRELGVSLVDPTRLWYDNIGATYLSQHLVLYVQTKHVELDYHFVRERVAAKTLQISFIFSKDQVANIMTKPLSSA